MYIHEYQAKQILAEFKVPVKKGKMIEDLSQIPAALKELADGVIVVKAQIHAGGRGKAGGVKIGKTKADVEALAKPMLGMTLVTHQTGPEGSKVNKLYLEEGSNIEKEYYLSILVDRETSRITIMASAEGGVEIEEVAAHNPEKIFKIAIDPASGIQAFHARDIAFKLGLKGDLVKKFTSYCLALYDVCIAKDASQVEINPLVVTKEGELVTLDAKFDFDDNALFRHPEISAMRDEAEEDPLEVRAAKAGLSYVKMDGTIGCMVNGAGLAMATMDIIKLCGGEPANFLDVGGGATRERVTEAFKIILSDKNVKGILVNIFGGIMRCDIIAEGVVAAAKDIGLSVPLVVRLAGTNVDLGKKILETSGLKIISADDLGDAAKKIVKAISE